MLVLALDTSTPAVTVAAVEGDACDTYDEVSPNRQGELLAVGIRSVLRGRRPDVVVVGLGPGPFTGLRVGIVTAAALGDAWGVPVHGACSLDGLAPASGEVVVVTDARRREVYWARYRDGARIEGPGVDAPAALAARLADVTVVGPATALYATAFAGLTLGSPDLPRAGALVARVDLTGPPEPLTPLYLRRPDAAETYVAKSVLS